MAAVVSLLRFKYAGESKGQAGCATAIAEMMLLEEGLASGIIGRIKIIDGTKKLVGAGFAILIYQISYA